MALSSFIAQSCVGPGVAREQRLLSGKHMVVEQCELPSEKPQQGSFAVLAPMAQRGRQGQWRRPVAKAELRVQQKDAQPAWQCPAQ